MNSYGKFKDFEIRDICFLGDKKPADRPKYEYDIVKWDVWNDKPYCYSIGRLYWNDREPCFEFEGVGLRYQEYSTKELDEWLIKWCELKAIEIRAQGDNNE